jgi:hypothetical protein
MEAAGTERVELFTGLSEEQLSAEYRRAWVFLLPLSESTANNSFVTMLNPSAVRCVRPVMPGLMLRLRSICCSTHHGARQRARPRSPARAIAPGP